MGSADPAIRLRRSDPAGPGIRRLRCGRGFRYLGAGDQPVRDPQTLARIKALVIPPAWKDVWICAEPGGHIQAVGTDAAGRRQYRYHDLWRERVLAAAVRLIAGTRSSGTSPPRGRRSAPSYACSPVTADPGWRHIAGRGLSPSAWEAA